MPRPTIDDTPWPAAPCVYVVRPACPACWHEKYIPIRSDANGDDSVTLKAVCRQCSRRFKIVTEPMLPDYGNLDDDLS
jgi:hypothetical protein